MGKFYTAIHCLYLTFHSDVSNGNFTNWDPNSKRNNWALAFRQAADNFQAFAFRPVKVPITYSLKKYIYALIITYAIYM